MLEPEAYVTSCEQLTVELKDISSVDEAATWAHWVIETTWPQHPEGVEQAFQERLPERYDGGYRCTVVSRSPTARTS
jgi:hypothetical protein